MDDWWSTSSEEPQKTSGASLPWHASLLLTSMIVLGLAHRMSWSGCANDVLGIKFSGEVVSFSCEDLR